MSKESLEQLVRRAASDDAFRARLDSDPEDAVLEYDLTREEARALESRDRQELLRLGLSRQVVDGLGWWAL
jgi:hypothetical protein